MSEWLERITNEFCEERTVDERFFVDSIKERLYKDLTEHFLCSFHILLFNFFIDKGVGHIVEPRLLLIEPPSKKNWVAKQKEWEKFVEEGEWEYFIRK